MGQKKGSGESGVGGGVSGETEKDAGVMSPCLPLPAAAAATRLGTHDTTVHYFYLLSNTKT